MDSGNVIIQALIAPLAIGGISAVLGAIISILDKIVNNYGEVVIDINNGKRALEVNGGAPLLLTLSENGIFVPSACGGRGSCGACKVKILSDVGPHLPTETPYLSASAEYGIAGVDDAPHPCLDAQTHTVDHAVPHPDELQENPAGAGQFQVVLAPTPQEFALFIVSFFRTPLGRFFWVLHDLVLLVYVPAWPRWA